MPTPPLLPPPPPNTPVEARAGERAQCEATWLSCPALVLFALRRRCESVHRWCVFNVELHCRSQFAVSFMGNSPLPLPVRARAPACQFGLSRSAERGRLTPPPHPLALFTRLHALHRHLQSSKPKPFLFPILYAQHTPRIALAMSLPLFVWAGVNPGGQRRRVHRGQHTGAAGVGAPKLAVGQASGSVTASPPPAPP